MHAKKTVQQINANFENEAKSNTLDVSKNVCGFKSTFPELTS